MESLFFAMDKLDVSLDELQAMDGNTRVFAGHREVKKMGERGGEFAL